MKKPSLAFYSSGILFIIWEIFARILNLKFVLPWPTAILKRMWELRGPLFKYHMFATLKIAIVSIILSFALGIFLAVIMDKSKKVEEAIYPIIVTTQTIPTPAIAPIFILWFGYSIWSKVLVAVLIAFFPVTINLHDGLKSTKKDYIELFKSMHASQWDIFWKLKVPSTIPYFFSSLKMAVPLVLIGAAIGEWLGATAGLGYFSKRMMTQLDGAGVFAPIVLISVIAVLFVNLISFLEKKFLKWRGN
ncbi:MAG: ABC transporter permease [Fusobacterium sp. JB021]|nr:ABC transporter permease [Fusobacterium sp. JB021]MDP0506516.1 ABC transporter permease [Fusobacterium sp. JB019]MDP0506527.1 ABC transporter permease [Fusobacterium sp. JB019]